MYKGRNILKVACAIIEDNGKILAAQRGENMGLSFKWEFPGGKLEPGEDAESCIMREIREELDVDIYIKQSLKENVHDYGEKYVMLVPFVCGIKSGEVKCKEHNQLIWDEPQKLCILDWADADKPIYEEYMRYSDNIRQTEKEI